MTDKRGRSATHARPPYLMVSSGQRLVGKPQEIFPVCGSRVSVSQSGIIPLVGGKNGNSVSKWHDSRHINEEGIFVIRFLYCLSRKGAIRLINSLYVLASRQVNVHLILLRAKRKGRTGTGAQERVKNKRESKRKHVALELCEDCS